MRRGRRRARKVAEFRRAILIIVPTSLRTVLAERLLRRAAVKAGLLRPMPLAGQEKLGVTWNGFLRERAALFIDTSAGLDPATTP